MYLTPVCNAEIEKEKLCSSQDVEGGEAVAATVGGAPRGGGSGGGVSASLTPAIWEKTIPYDGETFHLEYMDLDEFLLENGIPVSLEEAELQKKGKGKSSPKVIATAPTTTPAPGAVSASTSSQSAATTSMVTSDPEETVTVTTLQPAKLEEEEEEEQEEESLSGETPAVEVKEQKASE